MRARTKGAAVRTADVAEAWLRAHPGVEVVTRDGPGAYGKAVRSALPMGEVPRLTDDASGYGPAGRGFIAHVDVPPEVQRAFSYLRVTAGFAARAADAQ